MLHIYTLFVEWAYKGNKTWTALVIQYITKSDNNNIIVKYTNNIRPIRSITLTEN